MPVEADQFRRLQGDIHRRAEGASEGHLPGGRLRLHQARRGTGSDQRDLSALLRVAQTKSNQEPLGHAAVLTGAVATPAPTVVERFRWNPVATAPGTAPISRR